METENIKLKIKFIASISFNFSFPTITMASSYLALAITLEIATIDRKIEKLPNDSGAYNLVISGVIRKGSNCARKFAVPNLKILFINLRTLKT
jgi:hypothetical protein